MCLQVRAHKRITDFYRLDGCTNERLVRAALRGEQLLALPCELLVRAALLT